jgi:50S ribosomal subunit-associated GTPase HflX
MAIINTILDAELLDYNGSAVSESDRDAAVAACDSAISNWDEIPSIWQHIAVAIKVLDDLSADEISAIVAKNQSDLVDAITAHSAISEEVRAVLTSRSGLITFSDNIQHN